MTPHRDAMADQRQQSTSLWGIIKEAGSDWLEDKASRLGAALAYYTIFSIAPLLVITLAIAGWIFGGDVVQTQFDRQMQSFVGDEGAEAVKGMLVAANKPKAGAIATVLGIITLLFGATGVFVQLKDAMNTIWEVQLKSGRGIWGFVRDYFLSFTMVLGIAFLFLVSLMVSTVLAAVTTSFKDVIPGPDFIAHIADVLVSLGVVIVLFALIFKYLPDVQIAWRDVWLGAFVTGILFTLGKYLIGLYLGTTATGSAFGAAGSLVILLIWTYYSAQILFFGAEITQVYARSRGSGIQPASNAEPAERQEEMKRDEKPVPALR